MSEQLYVDAHRACILATRAMGVASVEYAEARRTMRSTVLSTVGSAGVPAELVGSWQRGDFHLTVSGYSYSDVDLIWTGVRQEAHRTAAQASLVAEIGTIAALKVPKVSIHPRDYFALMPLEEQRAFNLAEVVVGLLTYPTQSHPYIIAKSLLLYGRQHSCELSWEVADRVNAPALFATRIGIGCEAALSGAAALRLARTPSVVGWSFNEVANAPSEGREILIQHFTSHRLAHTWIYQRVAAKLATTPA